MKIALFSGSKGFTQHAQTMLGSSHVVHGAHASLARLTSELRQCEVAIVHANSQHDFVESVIRLLDAEGIPVAIAADVPDLAEMLELSKFGVLAYFNSYMTDVHYQQMLTMVRAGQTWISPPLMAGALALARTVQQGPESKDLESVLACLTNREREIACDVASGKTNQEIADERHIAERTVKSHLTHIFKKLGTRNRQALTLRLRGASHASLPKRAGYERSRQTH